MRAAAVILYGLSGAIDAFHLSAICSGLKPDDRSLPSLLDSAYAVVAPLCARLKSSRKTCWFDKATST